MTDLEPTDLKLTDLTDLQEKLASLGLVLTLKEPTDAMLHRGWHCIDFDREGYAEGRTTWDRAPPHQTSMKEDVHDAFVLMNEEAQAEVRRRLRPPAAPAPRSWQIRSVRVRRGPHKPQP